MNGGIILKINAKQKYTTDAISSFFVKKLVEKNGGKVQAYEVRNDMWGDLSEQLHSKLIMAL